MARTRVATAAAVLAALTMLPAPTAAESRAAAPGTARSSAAPAVRSASAPMRVTTVLGGLDHPWDIAFFSPTRFLFTQRDRRTVSIGTTSGSSRVVGRAAGIWSAGETGLMAIELGPDFRRSRAFYTCHGYRSGSTQDVRVARWRLNAAATSARLTKTIVRGLPSTTGRHAGCALAFGRGGAL